MAWEGLVDEALVIVKAVDERYDGTSHNPWNEVECGDHYGRALASYGVFQAVCGFTLDGPAGEIGISPRLNPEQFAAFFSGPNGWGLATQTRKEQLQTNRFEVRWGSLRVATVVASVMKGVTARGVEIRCAGKTIHAKVEQRGDTVRVQLAEPAILKEDEVIEMVIRT